MCLVQCLCRIHGANQGQRRLLHHHWNTEAAVKILLTCFQWNFANSAYQHIWTSVIIELVIAICELKHVQTKHVKYFIKINTFLLDRMHNMFSIWNLMSGFHGLFYVVSHWAGWVRCTVWRIQGGDQKYDGTGTRNLTEPGPEIWRDRDRDRGRDQKYEGTGTGTTILLWVGTPAWLSYHPALGY